MARVAARVSDKRVLKLIRAFLNAGVMEDGLVRPVDEGTPQGGPLSPLLSNLVLDDLDKELERRGHRFCRYADDCVPRTYRRKEVRCCARDGGRSSGAGRQGQAPSHRKLLLRLKSHGGERCGNAGARFRQARWGDERKRTAAEVSKAD